MAGTLTDSLRLAGALALPPSAKHALDDLLRAFARRHGLQPTRRASHAALTVATARTQIDRMLARSDPPLPSRLADRGVVMCVGGPRIFKCAWVCLHMLRRTGCRLPIELWQLRADEVSPGMRRLVEPLEVRFVNAARVRARHPARILNAWELKPYAVIHSRFRHVILLDADNVPLIDPGALFDSPQYLETGAVFWPDESAFPRRHPIWRICRVRYRNEPRVESGQLLVDKARCWRPLQLTMFLNEHSDFFYRYVHGDKDTFQLAWRILRRAYSMPSTPMLPLAGAMCQHDFHGRRMFQHRVAKWDDPERRIPGFRFERTCRRLLHRLDALLNHD